jgi:NhaP-type Na+/H+ or K+/H+ antiporter
MLLFILVGAAMDINTLESVGLIAISLILFALVIRTIGVFLSLVRTKLTGKEKMFVIISYLPKATVQASIGSIPLSMGLSRGNDMLTIAVLSILITAPIGASLIDYYQYHLLDRTSMNIV